MVLDPTCQSSCVNCQESNRACHSFETSLSLEVLSPPCQVDEDNASPNLNGDSRGLKSLYAILWRKGRMLRHNQYLSGGARSCRVMFNAGEIGMIIRKG